MSTRTQDAAAWASHLGAALALALALLALTACGSAPPAVRQASGEVSALPILVSSVSGNLAGQNVANAVGASLARAGYVVVRTPEQPHELVATVRTQATEDKSLFTVRVNGQVQRSYTVHARIEVSGGGRLIGAANLDFDADEPITEALVAPLAAAVAGPQTAAYATWLSRQRSSQQVEAKRKYEQKQARNNAEREAAQKRQEQEQLAAYNQLLLSDCSSPTQLDGCEPVERFIDRYPTSPHAADAKKALEEGKPKIAKLEDEHDWTLAMPESCRKPRALTDCDGVVRYVQEHPAGAHFEEATQIAAEAQPKLERLPAQANQGGE